MKNKKIIKKFVKTLSKAEQFAVESRDIEALVAISDRWYALLQGDDDEQHQIALGFISQESKNDGGKTSN